MPTILTDDDPKHENSLTLCIEEKNREKKKMKKNEK